MVSMYHIVSSIQNRNSEIKCCRCERNRNRTVNKILIVTGTNVVHMKKMEFIRGMSKKVDFLPFSSQALKNEMNILIQRWLEA